MKKQIFFISIFLLIVLSMSSYALLTDDLISFYSFDGNTTNDNMSVYNGINHDAIYKPDGKIGGSYEFFQNQPYWIELTTTGLNFPAGQDFTISAWVNLTIFEFPDDTPNAIYATRNSISEYSSGALYYTGRSTGATIQLNILDYSGQCYVDTTQYIVSFGWTYVVATCNNENNFCAIYINGSVNGNSTCNQTPEWAKDTMIKTIGTLGDYNGYYWNGDIDLVGIWNRSLSSEEVLELYNDGYGLSFLEMTGVIPECNSTWICNTYTNCLPNNTKQCVTIIDTNFCNNTYEGNYSEFTDLSCVYNETGITININNNGNSVLNNWFPILMLFGLYVFIMFLGNKYSNNWVIAFNAIYGIILSIAFINFLDESYKIFGTIFLFINMILFIAVSFGKKK